MPVVWTVQISQGDARAVAFNHTVRLITNTTRRVFNRANILTPVDTGRLRAGNQFHVRRETNRVVGEVFNNTRYARAVHDGTPAHTIRPKPKQIIIRPKKPGGRLRFVVGGRVVYAKQVRTQKPLRFVVAGRVVYARSVRMPARRGRPWIARALKEIAGPEGYTLRGV